MPSWQSLRGPELESDKALTPDAQLWLSLLPEFARPQALCTAHPRIANRLALIWADRPAVKLYFDNVLIDKRPGRVGFSPDVRAEFLRLRVYHETELRDHAAVRDWKLRFAQARKQSTLAPSKQRPIGTPPDSAASTPAAPREAG
ncbi:MAG: hypothetical protein ABIX46_03100 [Burkholderiaceae bacterium]